MKYLEIIELCTANTDHQFFEKQAEIIKNQIQAKNTHIKLFWNSFVDTDFSVHLCYENDNSRADFSATGMQIASALKKYGLVRHTLWIQQQ